MPLGDAITALINEGFPLLAGWTLMAARFMGMAFSFPMFSWVPLPFTVRFAFAAGMALPVAYVFSAGREAEITSLAAWQLATYGMKEFGIGFLIGVVAGLPFWIAQSAGELIDTYRGSSAGALFDPSLTTETSELGAGLVMTAIAVFVWSGGITTLVAVMFASFAVWDPLHLVPALGAANATFAGAGVGKMLAGALGMAGPVIVFLFAVDLALAFAARSTRQFQVFELTLTVKNTAFVFAMPFVAAGMVAYMTRELSQLSSLIELLKGMLP